MSESYTALSDEALDAIQDALPIAKFPMELNQGDMMKLTEVLHVVANTDLSPGYPFDPSQEHFDGLSEWAANFLSSIATTLDIELI